MVKLTKDFSLYLGKGLMDVHGHITKNSKANNHSNADFWPKKCSLLTYKTIGLRGLIGKICALA